MHVDTSHTRTVSTWPTLDYDRVGYEYSDRSRADEANRASAKSVDCQRRRVVRQQTFTVHRDW